MQVLNRAVTASGPSAASESQSPRKIASRLTKTAKQSVFRKTASPTFGRSRAVLPNSQDTSRRAVTQYVPDATAPGMQDAPGTAAAKSEISSEGPSGFQQTLSLPNKTPTSTAQPNTFRLSSTGSNSPDSVCTVKHSAKPRASSPHQGGALQRHCAGCRRRSVSVASGPDNSNRDRYEQVPGSQHIPLRPAGSAP